MKVLKLSVDYDGWYGGDVHEYCLLPIEWNGLYVSELSEGSHERSVYLGEIEGKHSEVYGDLTVEEIDLSTLNAKELSDLVKGSSVGEFECTFEGWESDFHEENEDELDNIDSKRTKYEELNRIKYSSEWSIKSVTISESLINKLKSNLDSFTDITIKASDMNKAIAILNDNGIEVF